MFHDSLHILALNTAALLPNFSRLPSCRIVAHTDHVFHVATSNMRSILKQHPQKHKVTSLQKQLAAAMSHTTLVAEIQQCAEAWIRISQKTNGPHPRRHCLSKKSFSPVARAGTSSQILLRSPSSASELVSSPLHLCSIMATALAQLGGPPDTPHDETNFQRLRSFIHPFPNPSPCLPPTFAEFQAIISRGKVRKAPGPDNANFFLLTLLPLTLPRPPQFLLSITSPNVAALSPPPTVWIPIAAPMLRPHSKGESTLVLPSRHIPHILGLGQGLCLTNS